MKNPAVPSVKKRILIAALALSLVGFGVLAVRLFDIQIVNAEEYQKQATTQQLRVTEISAKRGSILDANGDVLAMSSTAWTVCLSPASIASDAQRELIVNGLSELLELDPGFVREKSERDTYYEIIKKRIDRPLMEKVSAFAAENGITAISMEEDNKRYYPYDNFAAGLLGFTGTDGDGAYGIESYYDSVLSGSSGRLVSLKNAWGTNMGDEYDQMYEAENGNSLKLTIDEGIQHFVEKHLEIAAKEHDVQARACCIVMNAKTGAVLAMATKGDFDPNTPLVVSSDAQEYIDSLTADGATDEDGNVLTTEEIQSAAKQQAQYEQWNNKAISDRYEPGSVFKIITLSAALETNTTTINDTFYCPGYIEVAGEKIECWKAGGHGQQTLEQSIRNSCNPAFITIGLRMGTENFRKYFEAFGLTEPTGIDLPGEYTSIYHDKENFREINLASSSMGQTFKVTPIQLITAVTAAVNGGYLYRPYVVQQVIDSDGSVISQTDPLVKRQVISEKTSATVRELLEGVVASGSGKNAQVPGYRIGGKTGTSEKLDAINEDGTEEYVSSFLAFAPADDPEIVMLILLDEAQMENPYGSVVAAPVAGAILAEMLPYLGIEPQFTEEELAAMTGKVDYVVDYKIHDAMAALRLSGYNTTLVGDGTTVVKQVPEAGMEFGVGGTVILYTDEASIPSKVEVPDVAGLSITDVNKAIVGAGLRLQLAGVDESGANYVAYTQFPTAGTMVDPDTVVEVEFTIGDAASQDAGAEASEVPESSEGG